jgi:hypothetical protein
MAKWPHRKASPQRCAAITTLTLTLTLAITRHSESPLLSLDAQFRVGDGPLAPSENTPALSK